MRRLILFAPALLRGAVKMSVILTPNGTSLMVSQRTPRDRAISPERLTGLLKARCPWV
jgi:hypothetical protein